MAMAFISILAVFSHWGSFLDAWTLVQIQWIRKLTAWGVSQLHILQHKILMGHFHGYHTNWGLILCQTYIVIKYLYALFHFILKASLWHGYYYFHFTSKS